MLDVGEEEKQTAMAEKYHPLISWLKNATSSVVVDGG